MRIDPKAPAFPPLSVRAPGIDVRAYIATKIMAAMAPRYNRDSRGDGLGCKLIAEDAVRLTDSLIERLNKEEAR